MRGPRENKVAASGELFGAVAAFRAIPWSWWLLLGVSLIAHAWRHNLDGIVGSLLFWGGCVSGHFHGWYEHRSRMGALLRRAFRVSP